MAQSFLPVFQGASGRLGRRAFLLLWANHCPKACAGAILPHAPPRYNPVSEESPPMIDHISIQVRDLAASATFYEAVLSPLGLKRLVDRPGTTGFGKRYPEFWLNHRPDSAQADAGTGAHICLRAPDEAAVTAFHAAAIAGGGASDG